MTLSPFGAGIWIVAGAWQVIAQGSGPAELFIVATGAATGLVAVVLVGGALADRSPSGAS